MDPAGTSSWDALRQAVLDVLGRVAENVPSLVAALLVALAGWVLARLARRAARQVASVANRFLDRAFRRGSAAGVRISLAFITVTGEVAFWLVLIPSLILAAGVIGVGSVGQWLNQIALHLPSVIVGIVILVVGYFLSVYLRELATSSARRGEMPAAAGLGRLVQGATLAVAFIVGLDQAGVDVALLLIVAGVLAGGLVTGLMLAFALGAGDHVRNLIGARNARHFLQPGVRLRVDDIEGEVLEISPTHVALDTAEGKTLLPAQLLQTRRVTIVTPAADGSAGDG